MSHMFSEFAISLSFRHFIHFLNSIEGNALLLLIRRRFARIILFSYAYLASLKILRLAGYQVEIRLLDMVLALSARVGVLSD